VPGADDLTTFMCRLSENPGSLNLLELSGSIQAYNGIYLALLNYEFVIHAGLNKCMTECIRMGCY
jgi:hypothetical protein